MIYLKEQTSTCHRTTLYSIFKMSSCRKPEIQYDLPKITQIKWICLKEINKQWSKILNYVDFIILNNYSIDFWKKREIMNIKSYAFVGIWTPTPEFWGYGIE